MIYGTEWQIFFYFFLKAVYDESVRCKCPLHNFQINNEFYFFV